MAKVIDQRPNTAVSSLGPVKVATSSRVASSAISTAPKPTISTAVQGQ